MKEKKISLEALLRIMLSTFLELKDYDFRKIDKEKLLNDREIVEVNKNLFWFRLVVMNYLLLIYREKGFLKVTPEEISKKFAYSLFYAFQDVGCSPKEAETRLNSFCVILEEYSENVFKMLPSEQKEIEGENVFQRLCRAFASKVASRKKDPEKHYLVLSIARQIFDSLLAYAHRIFLQVSEKQLLA